MTTPGAESVFVDTNILVYATIAESPLHEAARSRLQRLRESGADLFCSNQVLREYLVTLTRPGLFPDPPDRQQVLETLEDLRERYTVLPDNELVGAQLIQLMRSVDCAGKQVHDANIIATMLSGGVKALLTENVKDFKRFESYVTILTVDVNVK
jgi:predicted nucleic acid-binding protein